MSFLIPLYKPFDMKLSRAKGSYVFDEKGKAYLDSFSGIGVNIFGHCDEGIKRAITSKLKKYSHISNLLYDEDAEKAAEILAKKFDASSKVIFSNSGTEAVEAALKILKKDNPEKITVSFTGSFHGRTAGGMSLTGIKTYKIKFLPLLPGIWTLPFNDASALKAFTEENRKIISGIFLEPIQGSGGIIPLEDDFASEISRAQKNYGIAVVADEIQCGLGRTGKFFAFENFQLSPDIVIVGKALGGGLPLGAVVAKEKFAEILKPGDHGSTFAPNPVAISACLEVLGRLNQDVLTNNKIKGNLFFRSLGSELGDKAVIRGRGLMIGVETEKDAQIVKEYCFKNNVLINILGNRIIRLLPPYIITEKEILVICRCLSEGIGSAPLFN